MGVRPWEVEQLSIDEVGDYIEAYQEDRKELYKTILEAGRIAGFIPASRWDKRLRRLDQAVKFEWDKDTGVKHDPDQLKKWSKKIDEKYDEHGKLKPEFRRSKEEIEKLRAQWPGL